MLCLFYYCIACQVKHSINHVNLRRRAVALSTFSTFCWVSKSIVDGAGLVWACVTGRV